jgi:beta-N-acetylhexosaminidase
VSSIFDKPGVAARALQAGCDLIMMSAHWTDTNRMMSLAQNLLESLNRGELESNTFEASQKRIDRLLISAPVYSVQAMPEEIFAAHSALLKKIAE